MRNPDADGVDHINVYSKGKTSLGKYLSNFTECDLVTEDGEFKSVEGYWYWLSSKDDKLRSLYGFTAKAYGRDAGGKDWMDSEEFKKKICSAIEYKISRMPKELLQTYLSAEIPFVHYYNFKGKVIEPKDGKWILAFINSHRKHLLDTM